MFQLFDFDRPFRLEVLVLIASLVFLSANYSYGNNDFTELRHDVIFGGRPVNKEDSDAYRVVKLISFNAETKKPRASCSGAILEKDIIITAAHCAYGLMDPVKVVFYDPETRKNYERSVYSKFRPDLRYKKYKKLTEILEKLGDTTRSGYMDMALMAFDGGLPAKFQKVKLPHEIEASRGDTIHIVGFGDEAPDENGSISVARVNPKFIDGWLARNNRYQIVLSLGNNGAACSGDSGAPIFLSKGKESYLIGIVSRGLGDCFSEVFAASIYDYLDTDENGEITIEGMIKELRSLQI